MATEKIDWSSKAVFDHLGKAFPNKLPLDEISPYELGKLIGQQEVINNLKIKLEYKEENI